MNGGIVSIDRLPVDVLLLQREAQILTARQGTCPARRVLSGTRKTPEASCFGTIHWLVWASEILDAHGWGRSESRTNFLAAPFLRRRQNFSAFDRRGANPPTTSSLMVQPRTVSAPKKRREGGQLKHSCPSMIFLGTGKPPSRAAGLDPLDRNMPAT